MFSLPAVHDAGAKTLTVDEIGNVVFAKGVASAQTKDGPARILGRGYPLYEHDVVTTGKKSFAVIKLSDGTKMTLRPETVFAVDEYAHDAGNESMFLRLFKGGLRTVTGLISKRNPGGFRVGTVVATIGIRGTDFDARLCAADCAQEEQKLKDKGVAESSPVVARAAFVKGALTAMPAQGSARQVATGGPLYEGDTLETGLGSIAVLAFRDGTRMTMQSNTEFKIDRYSYQQNTEQGNAFFRLFKGGLRALTGIIGKRQPKSFGVATAVATIGIRGTGFDLFCEGACIEGEGGAAGAKQTSSLGPLDFLIPRAHAQAGPGSGLTTYVWDGTLELQFGDAGTLRIDQGQAVFVEPGLPPVILPSVPDFILKNVAPRPDEVDVPADLFDAADSAPGFYVAVRDGEVTMEQDGQIIELEAGDTGFADQDSIQQFTVVPDFIAQDPFPLPGEFDERVQRILNLITDELEEGESLECEVR